MAISLAECWSMLIVDRMAKSRQTKNVQTQKQCGTIKAGKWKGQVGLIDWFRLGLRRMGRSIQRKFYYDTIHNTLKRLGSMYRFFFDRLATIEDAFGLASGR